MHVVSRRDQVAPEARRIVVVVIEGEPCSGPLASAGPLGEQCRLAEPGRSADQDQLVGHRLVQTAEQVRARQEIAPDARKAELRGQQAIAPTIGRTRGERNARLCHRLSLRSHKALPLVSAVKSAAANSRAVAYILGVSCVPLKPAPITTHGSVTPTFMGW